MIDLHGGLSTATDAALISRVRLGDRHAFQALARRHLPAMRLCAELLDPGTHPARLVGESLDISYHQLSRGDGPQASLRTYLLLLTRRVALEPTLPRSATPFRDHPASELHPAVGKAFAALPEGWQAAVWHIEAECEPDDQVGNMLGVAPTAVRTLVTSARKELRRRLTAPRDSMRHPECAGYALRLARSRGPSLPRSVLRHATRCERCVVVVADVEVVERDLAGMLARQLLGPAGDAYLDVRRETATVG